MSAAIDPSLCAAEPAPDSLDDGFSAPAEDPQPAPQQQPAAPAAAPALGDKSPY
jgi:hypothetical protein